MAESKANIYKTAREYARISRVDAAEAFAISASCLKDYETDVRGVPDVTALQNVSVVSYTLVKGSALAKKCSVLRRFWTYPSG